MTSVSLCKVLGVSCVTDKKYIQNQKDFIKRERKIILRDHIGASCVLIILIAFLIFINASYEHPDNWKEVSITLKDYAKIPTGRGGSRLDIYDTDGNRYVINRNEGNIKKQLVVGQQYTFTCSDNFFNDTVEIIKIGDTTYLSREDSIRNYRDERIIIWVFAGIFVLGLFVVNLLFYHAGTSDRIKKIRMYKKRIYDREHKGM